MCVNVCVCVCQGMCGTQRTALWSLFPHYTFPWVLGIKGCQACTVLMVRLSYQLNTRHSYLGRETQQGIISRRLACGHVVRGGYLGCVETGRPAYCGWHHSVDGTPM